MDVLNVRRLVGDTLAVIVQSMSTLICCVAVAMVASWELSLIILVLIPIVGLQHYAQNRFLKGFGDDTKVIHARCHVYFIFALRFFLG